MWIKKQRIIDLESVVRNQQQTILKLFKKEYLGKNVKSGDCTFKVENVSIKNGEVFLFGGQQTSEANFLVALGVKNHLCWSISINVDNCELCAE